MPMVLRCAAGVFAVAACSMSRQVGSAEGSLPAAPAASGVETQYIDPSVRPQDDLYRYLNGKWLDRFEIPADKALYGSFTRIDDETQEQVRGIVESLSQSRSEGSGAAQGGAPQGGAAQGGAAQGGAAQGGAAGQAGAAAAAPRGDADAQKIADLYASFMDQGRLETLGLEPLKPTFAAIEAIATKNAVPAFIAQFNRTGIDAPLDFSVEPDPKDSSRYAVSITQSGLGMPDRDYYLKDDAKLKETRAKYLTHVETMLRMAGDADARRSAEAIVQLETAIAEQQWTRVANRDPIKTYNRVALADLPQLMPVYDWRRYLADTDLAGKVDYLIVRQPSYLAGLDKLLADTPLPVWRNYLKWRALSAAAPYLSKAFVDERFAFAGTVLSGIPENRPRWKRGLALLDASLGEALGKLYVEKYFPPPSKARMQALVRNLLEAYARDIDTLDWMSAQTKNGARAKLQKLVTKIGYPDKWRDYGALRIARDDLYGNVIRATMFEYQRDLDKLGKPIDRNEWFMTPQTVNAYYNPVMNEIVFPAAILQPPFFNAQADDAVNYGAIGAVIGHEISHGFDDRGSQYDADGNLRDWFTPDDHAKFAARTKALVAQYDAYEPVAGFHVNGELTLGENIADNSGLAIAYQAYRLSLGGRAAPVIDGFSGDQRFFLGWMQVWRGKVREAEAIRRVKTDPHSPPAVRGTATILNQPGFYEAFGVKPGDKMYLPPPERVTVW
jgi:putative endopeptidase